MTNHASDTKADSSTKSKGPRKDGDSVQRAREWGGGSKGSKGPITAADRANENSSAKS
jgi:hypothetical protein